MKIIKYALYGALSGLCIGLVLGYFVGCESAFTCAEVWLQAIFGCGDSSFIGGCQEFTSNPAVKNCIIFSTAICTLIGGAYGTFQTLQDQNAAQKVAELEQSTSAKKQRATWANEVKQKALNVNNTCSKNKASYKPLVSTTYKSNAQMTEIINELTKIAEKQGKVNSLAEELSKKGGASV